MAGGQVSVDLKLRITTYGSHNGMIIHSGVQHSNCSVPSVWPYSIYPQQPTLPPTIQYPVTPLPIQDVSQQIESVPDDRSARKEPSPPSSPVFSFDDPQSPPDEFIEPTNVQLNIFHQVNVLF